VNADCDDQDPCTVDTCQTDGTCRSDRVLSGDCQPHCAAEPNGCIPGGGPARSDCLAEALVRAPLTVRQGRPLPVVRCHDGDPSCDHDSTPGQCTFYVAWCFNVNDARLACRASGVTKLQAPDFLRKAVGKLTHSSAGGAAVVFSPPFSSTDVCTEIMACGSSSAGAAGRASSPSVQRLSAPPSASATSIRSA